MTPISRWTSGPLFGTPVLPVALVDPDTPPPVPFDPGGMPLYTDGSLDDDSPVPGFSSPEMPFLDTLPLTADPLYRGSPLPLEVYHPTGSQVRGRHQLNGKKSWEL